MGPRSAAGEARLIGQDADEPREQPAFAIPRVRAFDRREERLLEDVVRLVPLAGQVTRHPPQTRRCQIEDPRQQTRITTLAEAFEQTVFWGTPHGR